mmetsp:Transcript_9392/g.25560  ORF Transcript_9392/g.25560 Transcript_9392/m.25560 type:complete len:257 (+) Transcript_9392:388-1158(+)
MPRIQRGRSVQPAAPRHRVQARQRRGGSRARYGHQGGRGRRHHPRPDPGQARASTCSCGHGHSRLVCLCRGGCGALHGALLGPHVQMAHIGRLFLRPEPPHGQDLHHAVHGAHPHGCLLHTLCPAGGASQLCALLCQHRPLRLIRLPPGAQDQGRLYRLGYPRPWPHSRRLLGMMRHGRIWTSVVRGSVSAWSKPVEAHCCLAAWVLAGLLCSPAWGRGACGSTPARMMRGARDGVGRARSGIRTQETAAEIIADW